MLINAMVRKMCEIVQLLYKSRTLEWMNDFLSD